MNVIYQYRPNRFEDFCNELSKISTKDHLGLQNDKPAIFYQTENFEPEKSLLYLLTIRRKLVRNVIILLQKTDGHKRYFDV